MEGEDKVICQEEDKMNRQIAVAAKLAAASAGTSRPTALGMKRRVSYRVLRKEVLHNARRSYILTN